MVAKSEAADAAMSKFIGRARHAASPDQEISRKEYTVPANVPRQLCLAERTWLVGDRLSYADFRVASALPFAARPDCRCTSSPASPAGTTASMPSTPGATPLPASPEENSSLRASLRGLQKAVNRAPSAPE